MNQNGTSQRPGHGQEKGRPYTRMWYDLIAENGENIWEKPRSSGLYVFEMLKFRLIASRLRRFLKTPALVADMACGRGPLAVTLAERGYRVMGSDFSLKALRSFDKQAASFGIPRVVSDMFYPPFGSGCFDAVVLANVIEHLPDPNPALEQAARLLKPGGYLVIATPYRENLQARAITCPHCKKKFNPNGHLHSFDEESLARLVQSAGFSVDFHLRYHSPATEIVWSGLGELSYGFWTQPIDRIFNFIYPNKAIQMLMLAGKV